MPPTTAPGRVRVFLLDDHEVVRAGIKAVLETHEAIEVVGEASNELDGEAAMAALVPDVAVIDVRLGAGSGIETYRRVRSQHPSVRALVLTGHNEEKSLMSAIMAGASGYLLKDIAGARLVSSVLSVAQGENLIDATKVVGLMDKVRGRNEDDGALDTLTAQERRILALIAEGLSNKEIAESLFLVEKTVRNHITRILAKLGVQRRTQAALIAARMPERLSPNDDAGRR